MIRLLLLACLVLGSLTAVARAHPLAPSGLRVVEGEGEVVTLRFRTPVMRPIGTDVTPLYPQACSLTEPPRALTVEGGAVEILFSLRCPGGIVGETFGVRGLTEARTDVLWDLRRANGARASGLLHAGAATFVVPEDAGFADVLGDFVRLGVEHFATGYDHVLFVLALLFVLRGGRALFVAVTSFTVGHSVSLALVTFGIVSVPSAPVEVAIAASILLLALELGAPAADDGRGPIARHPALIPLAFGLLHGLGFASVLLEAGLPGEAVPLALLGFNIGVELGQLALVGAALALAALTRRLVSVEPAPLRSMTSYAIGAVAVMWIIERSVGLLG